MDDSLSKSLFDSRWNTKNGRISEAFEKARCVTTPSRAFCVKRLALPCLPFRCTGDAASEWCPDD